MAQVTANTAGLDAYMAQVKALDGHGAKFGITADTGAYVETRTDILDVAIINEFGTPTIPPRPFMRAFADRNRALLDKAMKQALDATVAGASAGTQLVRLGTFAQQAQQQFIRASPSWAIANAPATIKRKGSSKPLIHHSVMVNAIRYEVI